MTIEENERRLLLDELGRIAYKARKLRDRVKRLRGISGAARMCLETVGYRLADAGEHIAEEGWRT